MSSAGDEQPKADVNDTARPIDDKRPVTQIITAALLLLVIVIAAIIVRQ